MTTEEKFYAAVNVISNLPKNGAYQPSNELKVRFYAYYKQAMEGPCQQTKPAFWEVIKKAKWDAWSRLGNMSRTEAMNNYVEELKKIVETMSYTDNVANFLGSLDSFYESVPIEDLELVVGPVLERIRSQPGSPIGSRETSPNRVRTASRHITSSLETSPASSQSVSPLPPDTDGEEEEFKDTVESVPERLNKDSAMTADKKQVASTNTKHHTTTGQAIVNKESEIPSSDEHPVNGIRDPQNDVERKHERGRPREKKDDKRNAEFMSQIATITQNLQKDVDRITARVRTLEGRALNTLALEDTNATSRNYPKWWPLRECSPRMFTLFILWPFVAQAMIYLAQRYRRRRL